MHGQQNKNMFLSIVLIQIIVKDFVVLVGCSKISTVSIRTRPGLWEDPSQPETKQDRCLKEGCKNPKSHNSLHSVHCGVSRAELAVLRILPR